jgi:two-component system, chemotaxis family, chemotaxis protein CheY
MGKILVVDDEMLPIALVKEHLKGTKYKVDYEHRGEKALERLQTNPKTYQLVLVDRMMFGMDGMGLLKAMKEDPQLKDIPFIMQTGEAEEEEIEAAFQAGADEVLFKPIRKDILLDTFKMLLK